MSEHAAIQAPVKTTPAPQPVAVEALPQPEPVQQDLYREGLYRLPLQRKLSMGAADDPSEREADSMADKVMRMPVTPFAARTGAMPAFSSAAQGESLQRKVEGPEEDELRISSDWADRENRAPRMPLPYGEDQDDEQIRRKPLASFIQRKAAEGASTPVSPAVASGVESGKGTGTPLPAPARSFMESRFGADFSSVRVHADDNAARLSQELQAQAFTVGADVYFNRGKFAPESSEGQHLLAHELTHTVQQGHAGEQMVQAQGEGDKGAKGPAPEDKAKDDPDDDDSGLDPDMGAKPLLASANTLPDLITEAKLIMAHIKIHDQFKSLFIFTQSGLTIYDVTGTRILKNFAQRKDEPMFPPGVYGMLADDVARFYLEKGGWYVHGVVIPLDKSNFSPGRKAEIKKRKGHTILLVDFIDLNPSEIADLNIYPALGVSRQLPSGGGKDGGGGDGGEGGGGNQPEAWALDQVKSLQDRQKGGKKAPDTPPSQRDPKADQRKPDKVVPWVRPSDGAQFINIWVNKDHKTLKLDIDESDEKLQQRVEDATQQMRDKQVEKALKEEDKVTKGNFIPVTDSTYLGGENDKGPAVNAPAWRADITGPEVMTRESKAAYTMTLHYEDEDPSLLGQVLEAYSGAEFIWQIINITPLYQKIMQEREEAIKQKQEQLREGIQPVQDNKPTDSEKALDVIKHKDKIKDHETVTAMDAVKRDALWKSRHFVEDINQAENDLLHPFESQDGSTGAAVRSVLVNSFNLATADLHAVLSAGGLLVEAFAAIFEPHDHYEREIPFPDEDGYFLVRGVAQPRPRGPEGHETIRMPSVAVKVVEVKDIQERTKEELEAQDQNLQASITEILLNYQYATNEIQIKALRETLEWKVQEAAQSNRSFLNDQLKDLGTKAGKAGIEPDMKQRIEEEIEILKRATQAGGGLISEILRHQIGVKKLELEKAQKDGDVLGERRIEKELDQLTSRLDTATAREEEMRGDDQPIVRPQAVFVNEETGQTVPLLIELGQLGSYSPNAGYNMRLSDIAGTSSDEYDAYGKTRGEAIRHVIKEYAGHFPYGRGYMTVRIPAGTYFNVATTIVERCNPRDTAQASERLDELLAVLAIAGLFVPGVGTAVAIVGAAVAAARIIHRLNNHTFAWDTDTVMDVLNIIGAVAGGVSKLAGSRLVVARNMFAIVPESEELEAWVGRLNRIVRIADFVDTTVNEVSFMIGTMNSVQEYLDIQREEAGGHITHAEARRRRAQLMSHAMYDQFMQHGAHLVGHFFGDGAQVHAGKDRPPMEHPEDLNPVVKGIEGGDGRVSDDRATIPDKHGTPMADEHKGGERKIDEHKTTDEHRTTDEHKSSGERPLTDDRTTDERKSDEQRIMDEHKTEERLPDEQTPGETEEGEDADTSINAALADLPAELGARTRQPTIGTLLGDTGGIRQIAHVPVTRPEGLSGNETHVKFENGRVVLELGPHAGAEELRSHLETIRVLTRYEGALGYVRQLLSRVGALIGYGPGFGSRGFEARIEVEKLTGIHEDLLALRDRLEMAMDQVTTAKELEALGKDYNKLLKEIEAINDQVAAHAKDINSREKGIGYVAMLSTKGKILSSKDPKFGKEPAVGETVRYQDESGNLGEATRLSTDTVAILTRLQKGRTKRGDYQSKVDRAGLPSGRYGFEALHADGPIVGHESPYGIYFGAWTINQKRQRLGIEKLLKAFRNNVITGKELYLRTEVEKITRPVLENGGTVRSTGETLPSGTILEADGTILRNGRAEAVDGTAKPIDFLKSITYQVYGKESGGHSAASPKPEKLFELSLEAVNPTDPLTRVYVGSGEVMGKDPHADADVTSYGGLVFISKYLGDYVDMSSATAGIGTNLQATEPREEKGKKR